jgi:hypothetical protein
MGLHHLNLGKKLVGAARACLGLAPDSGITLMIPEHRPNETVVVLPKRWVKCLAVDGCAAN